MSPLAMGTSHAATESMVAALQGTPYDTGLDLKKLDVVRAHFAKLRQKYLDAGLLNPKVMGVDANTLIYQVPGGIDVYKRQLLRRSGGGAADRCDALLPRRLERAYKAL